MEMLSVITTDILILSAALIVWFTNHYMEEKALKKIEQEIEEEIKEGNNDD